METLYTIIIICFAIFAYVGIKILRGMAKLKEWNDRIYEEWAEGKPSKQTAKEIDCGYDFEFEKED